MTRHMMIDAETLGLGATAAHVQLGWSVFDPDGEGPVYADERCVGLGSSQAAGGTVDEGTVDFWMDQPDQARRAVFNRRGRLPLAVVLQVIASDYERHGCTRVWSQGLTFDVTQLEGYYKRLGLRCPWGYGDARDTRTTYEDAADFAGWQRPSGIVAHTGMADAVAQVRAVQGARRALRSLREARDELGPARVRVAMLEGVMRDARGGLVTRDKDLESYASAYGPGAPPQPTGLLGVIDRALGLEEPFPHPSDFTGVT